MAARESEAASQRSDGCRLPSSRRRPRVLRSCSLIGEVAVMIVTRQYTITYDAVREVYKLQSKEVPICPKCGAVMAGHGIRRRMPRRLRAAAPGACLYGMRAHSTFGHGRAGCAPHAERLFVIQGGLL